jgi:hypothetical protein
MKNKNLNINDKIQDFIILLDSLNITNKKKEIWKDIYANALQDRDYAMTMYVSVSTMVINDPTMHAIHGPNIAKYIERMSRSNDQLLKLAELLATAEEVSSEDKMMSPDEIYDQLAVVDDFSKKANNRR